MRFVFMANSNPKFLKVSVSQRIVFTSLQITHPLQVKEFSDRKDNLNIFNEMANKCDSKITANQLVK